MHLRRPVPAEEEVPHRRRLRRAVHLRERLVQSQQLETRPRNQEGAGQGKRRSCMPGRDQYTESGVFTTLALRTRAGCGEAAPKCAGRHVSSSWSGRDVSS